MLARQYRLRHARDIARVYKTGAYGGVSGVLSVRAGRSGHSYPRAVVVVAKKVSKRAVIRNRIRRRVIGVLEQKFETLKGGYDIVITVHSDISELPAAALTSHIHQTLARAGVLAS